MIFNSRSTGVCSVLVNAVSLLSAGTCNLQASQSGDSTYAPATPVVVSFVVITGSSGSLSGFGTGDSDQGDVPLPSWAYAALGLLLFGGMSVNRRRG